MRRGPLARGREGGGGTTELADIHCHILPYVDDGAEHLEDMEALLKAQAEQGIRVVCATPHLRTDMFTSETAAVRRQYERARNYIQTSGLPIRLFLGREYFCDETFEECLERDEVLPLGEGRTLLVEFSRRYSAETILGYIQRVKEAGYRPLVAHAERYPAVDLEMARELVGQGALLQVNAGSVLGREGFRQKRHIWRLMRAGLVHVVASDAHSMERRPPELGLCASKMERKMGQAWARKVLWEAPLEIVSPEK